jgi:hypothetical protein
VDQDICASSKDCHMILAAMRTWNLTLSYVVLNLNILT